MSIVSSRLKSAPLLTGNLIGILVSVTLHAVIVAVMMYHWEPSREESKARTPRFIEAKLLQMEPAVAEPPKASAEKPPSPPPPPPQEKQAEEQKQQREAERQRQEAQKQQEVARQKELERQQQLKREAERKRQQEQERKEQERQRELARQQEQKRQQDLAQALAREEALMEAQMAEEEAQQQVGTYVDYMASLVASNWSRPPSATRDMQVTLQLTLGSAGRVVGVQVANSSGNAAFDRAAEQAVWKVGQFSRLQEMDPALYQREFRKMFLEFKPEDLRM